MPAYIVITPASGSHCICRLIGGVCDFVCVGMSVHALKEKRLELSTPNDTMFSRNSLNRFVILGTNCLHDLLPPACPTAAFYSLSHSSRLNKMVLLLHEQHQTWYTYYTLWQDLGMHWPWGQKVKGHRVMKCAAGMSTGYACLCDCLSF